MQVIQITQCSYLHEAKCLFMSPRQANTVQKYCDQTVRKKLSDQGILQLKIQLNSFSPENGATVDLPEECPEFTLMYPQEIDVTPIPW